MPCNCDHLEPTHRETYSRQTAKLLNYVRKCCGLSPSKRAAKAANYVYGDEELADVFTAELCGLLRGESKAVRETIIYGDAKNPLCRELADWWEKHEKADADKASNRKAEKEKNRLIKSAKSKLTREEKNALGL